ncbi:hypothetical protein [Hoeflea sp.]|uniref:hypothetical protein n=1 Tax=Hoeflea sp. TaxID=1940281 RepID=UPI003B018F16
MTNIIVKKTDESDPDDRRKGMIKAGDAVNEWMTDPGEPAAKYFFDDIFDDVTDNDHKFFLDVGSAHRRLREGRRDGVYRFGKGRRLVVKCEDDGQDSDRNKKMTIGVPEDRADLLAGGYIDVILDDLVNILYPSGPATIGANDMTNARKYLLASIFLNRCH